MVYSLFRLDDRLYRYYDKIAHALDMNQESAYTHYVSKIDKVSRKRKSI